MKKIYNSQLNSRGDTIIEVLLALSILTLILFTSWNLVNRSTQVGLNARKRTDMVNQLKEQAEIIKAANAQNPDSYEDFANVVLGADPKPTASDDTTQYSEAFCKEDVSASVPGSNAFYVQSKNGALVSVDGAKKINDDNNSLTWVQYRVSDDGYVDFYVRGCWTTAGGEQKTDNAQFIIRVNKNGVS